MKKILSVAIASTFSAIILAQGSALGYSGENSCIVDNCIIHSHSIINALGDECTVNEIVLNYLSSKGKYNSCIDLEKLKEEFSKCNFGNCISNIFGGNCSGSEKPDIDHTNPPESDNDETLPDVPSVPDFEAPDIENNNPSVPDTPPQNQPTPPPPENTPQEPDNDLDSDSSNDSNSDSNQNNSSTGEFSEYVSQVIELINNERTKRGIGKVTAANSSLMKAAQKRAVEQAELFSHTRPNGQKWTTVLAEFGVKYSSAGENVAYGQKTPSQVMNEWMNSQGHRENILNANYDEVGVGVYYKNGTYYWSQLFIS